jgi:hypothetical protein
VISRLEIVEIPASCKVLKLIDVSTYNSDIPVSNGILEVTPPGFSCGVSFPVDQDFSITLNSSTLKIAPAVLASELIDLPDGIYNYKYSIKPNDQLFVEYASLRNCALLQKYYVAICELFSDRIKDTRKEFEDKRRALIWIKELIDASKYKVDEAAQETQGIEMYNEALRLLNRKNSCYC